MISRDSCYDDNEEELSFSFEISLVYSIAREEINLSFYGVAARLFFLVPRAVPQFPSTATANLLLRKRAPLSSAGFQEEETRVNDGGDVPVSLRDGQIMLGCDSASSCRDRNLYGANRAIIRLLCRRKFY